ncbi:hypothetical protein G7A66_05235 [Altererythrobacter sp. SALINAS58]|uniref:Rossmann fold domain-containing protein n=1 Tax=Alteripontixanthobacter muriae TaxID=2705546 RepID=UPI001575365E|nr:hypothetical protein [Alteripontixanthobacter muriae]NTZ42499.1 hypothetical protein [Alteripontixanthobacter muriae]
MGEQLVLQVDGLPPHAIEAAAVFHATWMPQALAALTSAPALLLQLPAAPYDHDDWRRAAIRDLARRTTPHRANLIAGGDAAAIESAIRYLAKAPSVTGQLLKLAGTADGA